MPEQNQQAVTEEVAANFNKFIDMKEYKFRFNKDELGNKRETIELKLPVPSVEGIIEILKAGGKQLEMLQEAVGDVIAAYAKSVLNDNETMTAANFPIDSCNWETIANLPESEKRGRGISKEVWTAFAADYLEIMPGLTGKEKDSVALAAKLFLNKFQQVKTNKPVIQKLQEQLTIYSVNAPKAENFSECVKFLSEKAEALLAADETAMLANL